MNGPGPQGPGPATRGGGGAPARSRRAGSVVFVIDDDPDVREALGWVIRSAGFEVVVFRGAEELLAAVSAGRPGCVVLDLRLQDTDGLRLLEELVRTRPGLPVIAMSAFGDSSTAAEVRRRGAVDYLQKPFHNEDLLESIRRALGPGPPRPAGRLT